MFGYFTDVGKAGEATSTSEVREFRLILTSQRIILRSKIQFCKVNETLQTGEKLAQIQQNTTKSFLKTAQQICPDHLFFCLHLFCTGHKKVLFFTFSVQQA